MMTTSPFQWLRERPGALVFVPLAGLFVLLLLVPGLWGAYGRILLFAVLILITLALSYDVVGGLLGYLHLGHGLFFGIGSYVTALALEQKWTLLPALLLTASLTMATGAALSGALFRLRGAVFALTTLGLLFLGGQLVRNFSAWTGGAAGLSLRPDLHATTTLSLSVALALAMTVTHWLLSRSRLGLKMRTIRENEDMAESIGINCSSVKRAALIISAVPAALAGGLHVREISFVIPGEAFGLETSLAPVLICLLFRPGSTWGPLLGALTLTAAQELIWTSLPYFRLSLYGLLLIVLGIMQTRTDA
jgi:branched-chain amino acid transport system permease protein